MTAPPRPAVLALADDLSGAAEIAQLLASSPSGVRLVLAGDTAPVLSGDVCVVDLDSRHLPADDVAGRVAALAARARSAQVLVKLDSLLRGPLTATVGAVGPVVVAPALPALDRVVVDGVPSAAGLPLSAAHAWATEGWPAPATVADALAPLPVAVVGLAAVRGPGLATVLADLLAAGRVPVCDGVTDADCDAVVAAVATLDGVALAGSGGLAAALGRTLGAAPAGAGPRPRPGTGCGPLVVVGTAEATAAAQVAVLAAAGVPVLDVPVAALLDPAGAPRWAAQVAAAVAGGPLVLRPDPTDAVDPARSRTLSTGLARLVADALRPVQPAGAPVDLVLTGGETARRVLDALGVHRLAPRGSVHHGAVVSTADDGRTVVTRPGSFGGPDSLLAVLGALAPTHAAAPGGTTEGTTR